MPLHESGEMYIETIYVLTQQHPAVRAIDVGEHMGFSKPSVSRALGILKNGGYVTVSPEGYLKLTEKGLDVAQKIIEDIRANLPRDIQQARWLDQERDRIINDAKKEYNRMINEAKEQVEYLVNNNSIYKDAQKRADALLKEAE